MGTSTEVRWLRDRAMIHDLMARYLDRIDARDPHGAAAVFADDAVADFLTGRKYQGRAAIARVLEGILSHFERTSHHLSNHVATIDGDHAQAHTYVYAFHRMASTGGPWHFWGRHVDLLRRGPDGWLIADRRLVGVDAHPARPDVPGSLFDGHAAATDLTDHTPG